MAGSKVFPVTPSPDQIPPKSWAVRIIIGPFTHSVSTGVIVASGTATVRIIWSESLHPFASVMLYVIT